MLPDPDEIAELRAEKRRQKRNERCQCDVSWGICPGPNNCNFSEQQEEQHDNHKEQQP